MLNNEEIELSSCTQHWNFLYVKDAAALIHKASRNAFLDKNFHFGIYNLASNDTRVLKDYVENTLSEEVKTSEVYKQLSLKI